jgi:hypothetical protein
MEKLFQDDDAQVSESTFSHDSCTGNGGPYSTEKSHFAWTNFLGGRSALNRAEFEQKTKLKIEAAADSNLPKGIRNDLRRS